MQVSSAKQTRQRLGFLFSLPLFLCIVFFLFQIASRTADNHLQTIKNLESNVNHLHSLAIDAESSERGFLLTGDEAVLARFAQAQFKFKLNGNLPADTADLNLNQQLQDLTKAISRRFDQTSKILDIQKTNGFGDAIKATKSDDSEATMKDIQSKSSALINRLNALEQADHAKAQWISNLAFIFFSLGTLLMIAVMYWLYNEVLSYIDARDQAQEQLEVFNSELQTMIDERTRDLVEANRELQQFANVASHDLQEPLRTITSFSQLLVTRYQGQLGEDADEFIGFIVTACKRMQDLINGLLQIGRLRRAGTPTLRVSFNRLLDEAEASLQASIRENNVRIDRNPMPELMVDRVQMMQLFQNLISNAIKYRRTEPPVIHIFAQRKETEWQFSVADNGCGFSQEFAERIFGLFSRLHGRDVQGTGMGLYIARRIIERHGGRIWAESKEGLGTTFFFTLPIALEAPKSTGPPSSKEITKDGIRSGAAAAKF